MKTIKIYEIIDDQYVEVVEHIVNVDTISYRSDCGTYITSYDVNNMCYVKYSKAKSTALHEAKNILSDAKHNIKMLNRNRKSDVLSVNHEND